MKYKVFLRDLKLSVVVGILPEEHGVLRPIEVNAQVICEGGGVDAIEAVVDYRVIESAIVEAAEGTQDGLLETLANRMAEAVYRIPGVVSLKLCVDKPGALVHCRSVAVEVERPSDV